MTIEAVLFGLAGVALGLLGAMAERWRNDSKTRLARAEKEKLEAQGDMALDLAAGAGLGAIVEAVRGFDRRIGKLETSVTNIEATTTVNSTFLHNFTDAVQGLDEALTGKVTEAVGEFKKDRAMFAQRLLVTEDLLISAIASHHENSFVAHYVEYDILPVNSHRLLKPIEISNGFLDMLGIQELDLVDLVGSVFTLDGKLLPYDQFPSVQTLNGCKQSQMLIRYDHPLGHHIWLLIYGSCRYDEEGKPLGVRTTYLNVSPLIRLVVATSRHVGGLAKDVLQPS
jgi:hypothetical protein